MRNAPPALRTRTSWPRRRAAGQVLLICLMLGGCRSEKASDGGSSELFGFFKRKPAKLPSTVSPELHATLQREPSLPHDLTAAPDERCSETRVEGLPPAAHFVPPDFTGLTHPALRVASQAGLPPLGIVSSGGERPRPQFWELASDSKPSFVRQLPVQLDPAESTWLMGSISDVGCLPGPLLALGVRYHVGRPHDFVALFNRQTHQVRKLGDADGMFQPLMETRSAGPDAELLLYHSDSLRLRAEDYVSQYDHLWLFSPKHPQGLEVLTLGLDDGNVRDWAVVGKTLWLRTVDRRDKAHPDGFFWSLDLSPVL